MCSFFRQLNLLPLIVLKSDSVCKLSLLFAMISGSKGQESTKINTNINMSIKF